VGDAVKKRTRAELLEMLDNVSAAARNMLAQMPYDPQNSDYVQRTKIIEEARSVCDDELRAGKGNGE
jgi:hypothetical protein